MLLHSTDLLHLPVHTRLGQRLGRVVGFDLELDGQAVAQYYVRTGLMKGLWHQELVINRRQVISISAERMVVEDSVGQVKASAGVRTDLAAPLV